MMDINLLDAHKISDGVFSYPLPVVRVLYEAEQPIIYLTRTLQGEQLLAYLAGEAPGRQFVVAAPCSAMSLALLESGALGIREALTNSWLWLVRVNFGMEAIEVWSVSEHDLPPDRLPRPGTLLFPA